MNPESNRIIESLDPEVSRSLTDKQRDAILKAVAGEELESNHKINIRVPLYFARYYFVFQFGRDRRSTRRRLEARRRRVAAFVGNVVFFLMVASPLTLILFAVLYLLKTAMGIDLFPDSHLPHLFGLHK